MHKWVEEEEEEGENRRWSVERGACSLERGCVGGAECLALPRLDQTGLSRDDNECSLGTCHTVFNGGCFLNRIFSIKRPKRGSELFGKFRSLVV
mgnify:CR=1 FL=1